LLVFYDEAHKFAGSPAVRRQMGTLVRERRHLGVSVIVSSQDPLSVPEEILPLLDCVGVCRHDSREWSRQLGKVARALGGLGPERTRELPPGTLWLWARDWHVVDEGLTGPIEGPVLLDMRPRLSQHGGATRPAVAEAQGDAEGPDG
jgi:hypothetical protein